MPTLRLKSFTAAIVAAALLCVPAQAASVARIQFLTLQRRVALIVNGVPAFTFTASGGLSAADRTGVLSARLSDIAASGLAVRFSSASLGSGWSVTANGQPILSPSHEDAARQRTSRKALARLWAARLTAAWNTAFLKVTPDGFVVGIGRVRTLSAGGGARGALSVVSEPPGLVETRVLPSGKVAVWGRRQGRGSVTVRRDGAEATAAFLVMKEAGSVRPVVVEVTGASVPRPLLENAVEEELRRAVTLEPGSWSVLKSRPRFPRVWTRGNRLRYAVPVRIAGPNALAVETSIPVTVLRRKLPGTTDVTLFYSNKPERVLQPQQLFRHAVEKSTPVRLLYHHQNMARDTMTFSVDLWNSGSTAVPLQLLDASAPASEDTVQVGHVATYKYLKRIKSGVGVIINVPPLGRRRVMTAALPRGKTLSGMMLLRPLGEGSLMLTMRADAAAGPQGRATTSETETVFPSPDKTVNVTYRAGGPWTYVPLGRRGVVNAEGVRLSGDYGVLYTIRATLENPSPRPQTVRIMFEPQAGAARGAFIIDGALMETGTFYPPAETKVATIRLRPGETRRVTIVTMPAAGGAYPAGLIVRG